MKLYGVLLVFLVLAGGLVVATDPGPNIPELVQKIVDEIAQLTTAVTGLQTQTNQLQSEVSTLQGDVSTLQGNVSTLQTQVNDLENESAQLNTNVTFLQMDVSDLQTLAVSQGNEIDTHALQISDLDSRVTVIENAPGVDYTIVHRFLRDDATGNALGWKPNSNLVGFFISENALQEDSVISVFANSGVTPCFPYKLLDTNGVFTGFLIGCPNPVPDGSTLAYTVTNPQ